MSTPAVGDRAPEVALPDENGTIHRLSDQHDRWTLVYFYPEDDTPGCTTEACQFRDLDEDIRDEGAEVWGISPDGAASHRRFREKFAPAVHPAVGRGPRGRRRPTARGRLKKNYGREYMGIIRSSFLVDPAGRIARAWPRVKADGHAAEVLAALAEAKAAAAG